MENSLSILPLGYNVDFIIEKAGVTNHFGYETKEDGIHFRYLLADYDAVLDAIESYSVDYLVIERPAALEQVSMIRDAKIAGFTFNGLPIVLDLETVANITAATVGLERNTQVDQIEWSLGEGQFITIPRDMMFGLADYAFLHVQACFARHKMAADQINACTDIEELAALDLEAGWPS